MPRTGPEQPAWLQFKVPEDLKVRLLQDCHRTGMSMTGYMNKLLEEKLPCPKKRTPSVRS